MATCEACRTTPAVVVEGYEAKGKWVEVGKWRVCELVLFLLVVPFVGVSFLFSF